MTQAAHRVAVVTGAGAGIGRAIAETLGGCGLAILVVDRDEGAARDVVAAIASGGGVADWLALDIAENQAPDEVEWAARERLGSATILVNNAAAGGGEPFDKVTTEQFDRVFSVSARAAFFLAQALLPGMRAAGWGRIVNISSLIAARGAAGNSHYAGAKAAMIGFVRSWAVELAPFGITANTVLPALTDTPMTRAAFPSDFIEERARTVPGGRLARPEDVATLVAFLCSDAAAFVTGQAISPNGGEFVGAM